MKIYELELRREYFLISLYFFDRRLIACIFLGCKAKTPLQVDLEIDLSHYRPGWSILTSGWIKREGKKASLLSIWMHREILESSFCVLPNSQKDHSSSFCTECKLSGQWPAWVLHSLVASSFRCCFWRS